MPDRPIKIFPMPYPHLVARVFLILMLTLGGVLTAQAQKNRPSEAVVAGALDTLRAALAARDFAVLEPRIAPNFRYTAYEGPLARHLIKQTVNGYREAPDRIEIARTEPEGVGLRVAVVFVYPNRRIAYTLRMTSGGQFVEIPIMPATAESPDPIRGVREDTAAARRTLPAHFESTFIDANGLLLVEGTADGRQGYFLLDNTRAEPCLHYPQKTAPERVRVGSLRWESYEWRDTDLPTEDLSIWEAWAGKPLLGALGYAHLEPYEVVIDYPQKRLELTLLAANGQAIAPRPEERPPPADSLGFSLKDYLPVFSGGLGGNPVRMGLSLRTPYHQIRSSLLPRLGEAFRALGPDTLLDGTLAKGGEVAPVLVGTLPAATWKVVVPPEGARASEGVAAADVCVGTPWVRAHRVAINYKIRKIYWWPE